MKKRIIALALLAVLALTLFAACGKTVLSSEAAQKKALEALGIPKNQVTDIHTHVVSGDVPGYSIHITHGGEEITVFVDAVTGEVKQ